MDEKGLGMRLQRARKAAGFTQQELCHEAGLSYSTLAKIERGAIKAPSIFTIQRISEILKTPLDVLVGAKPVSPQRTAKKRSKSGVRFVYFDINGCLVRFFHRAFSAIAEDTGASADVIEAAFWHYNDDICRGNMSLDAFNKALAKQMRLPDLDWQKYYLEAVDPIEEMHEAVRWAAENYEVGLLSNIMPGFIDEMKRRQLIPDVSYRSIIDSSVVHSIKPEAEIYEIAEAKAGVNPQEIMLIDDSRSNLMAAERRGWHVMWFDDYEPVESVKRVRDALEPEK